MFLIIFHYQYLDVDIGNINQYEHEDDLVIWGNIIPHGAQGKK